jgi:predicted lipid-binding transport protein (Tim44 family)
MKTTEPITPTAPGPPTRGDVLADVLPVIGTVYVAGPPVLLAWAGTVLFALMLTGSFALLVTLVAVFAAAAALVTLAGAILATPYLLIRHFHQRLAERRHLAEGSAPIATVVARTASATKRPAIAAFAASTTARTSR